MNSHSAFCMHPSAPSARKGRLYFKRDLVDDNRLFGLLPLLLHGGLCTALMQTNVAVVFCVSVFVSLCLSVCLLVSGFSVVYLRLQSDG